MAYRKWVWCRDTATGAHLDIDYRRLPVLLKAGAVEVIEDYPPNEGQDARPRPAKPFRPIADRRLADPSEEPIADDRLAAAAAAPVEDRRLSDPETGKRTRKTTAPAEQPTDTTSTEGNES